MDTARTSGQRPNPCHCAVGCYHLAVKSPEERIMEGKFIGLASVQSLR
jgi:hypothetical protein